MLTKGENSGQFEVPDNCLHTLPCERREKKSKKNLHLDSKREATDQLYFALFILVDFFANEYE